MFELRAPAFAHEASIPERHTCDGEDLSPELRWSDPPAGTKCFVLVVDDPDAPDPAAPKRTWIHWVRYNIPADVDHLDEGAGNEPAPDGQRDALNDSNEPGWSGPARPSGGTATSSGCSRSTGRSRTWARWPAGPTSRR